MTRHSFFKPLPFRSLGVVPSPGRDQGRPNWDGGGGCLTERLLADSPHPNPSPEGEGL